MCEEVRHRRQEDNTRFSGRGLGTGKLERWKEAEKCHYEGTRNQECEKPGTKERVSAGVGEGQMVSPRPTGHTLKDPLAQRLENNPSRTPWCLHRQAESWQGREGLSRHRKLVHQEEAWACPWW